MTRNDATSKAGVIKETLGERYLDSLTERDIEEWRDTKLSGSNRYRNNSYRAEKKAAMTIALPDDDAEIDPWSMNGGGRKPEPEMDRLSNIVKAFNDQFGGLFDDVRRMEERITGEIPDKVNADQAYQNAKKNSDRQNARIEHDKALKRVITALRLIARQSFGRNFIFREKPNDNST